MNPLSICSLATAGVAVVDLTPDDDYLVSVDCGSEDLEEYEISVLGSLVQYRLSVMCSAEVREIVTKDLIPKLTPNHPVFIKQQGLWRYGRSLFIEECGFSEGPLPFLDSVDHSVTFGVMLFMEEWDGWKSSHPEIFDLTQTMVMV